jgi:hypothetical protein
MSPWWLLVFFAIFFIGVTKSGFGSGVGLMIVPMTLLAMGHLNHTPQDTLGLMLPLLVLGDVIAVSQYYKRFNRPAVGKLLIGTAVGVVFGWLLLSWFNSQKQSIAIALVEVEVGLESVGLVGLHWYRMSRGSMAKYAKPGMVQSNLTGAAAGVSSTLAHAAGPIIALYLLPQKLDRAAFVGTSAVYFCLLNLAKLPAYWASHDMNARTLALSAKMLPLVIAGAVFGRWLNRHISDALFSRIVYFVTFCLGWYLLIIGVQALRTW